MFKVKENWQRFSEEVCVQRPIFLERDQKGPATWLVLLHASPRLLAFLCLLITTHGLLSAWPTGEVLKQIGYCSGILHCGSCDCFLFSKVFQLEPKYILCDPNLLLHWIRNCAINVLHTKKEWKLETPKVKSPCPWASSEGAMEAQSGLRCIPGFTVTFTQPSPWEFWPSTITLNSYRPGVSCRKDGISYRQPQEQQLYLKSHTCELSHADSYTLFFLHCFQNRESKLAEEMKQWIKN